MTRPFADIRVLDLSNRLSGAFAARLFGDFGAEVILAEPPEGHPLRHEPPFLNNEPSADSGILHAYVNWNKKSIVVTDAEELARLIASSEIVITTTSNFADAALAAVGKHSLRDTIHISITPHGLDGPLVDSNGNNLTACARTGWSYINVLKDEPPLQLPNQVSGYVAGIAGFITGAAALYQRDQTGSGERAASVKSKHWRCVATRGESKRSSIIRVALAVYLAARLAGFPGPCGRQKTGS